MYVEDIATQRKESKEVHFLIFTQKKRWNIPVVRWWSTDACNRQDMPVIHYQWDTRMKNIATMLEDVAGSTGRILVWELRSISKCSDKICSLTQAVSLILLSM
jgi:hypothetical protein